MPKSFRWVALAAALHLSLPAWLAAQDRPVLRIAYFIPADREPEPEYLARLDRVLTNVQGFYRDGMRQHGYGERSFDFDRDDAKALRIHEVRGAEPMRAYGRNAGGKVREEVRKALAERQIDIDHETVLVFQLLLEWSGETAIEIGPYAGGGDATSGIAFVYDDGKLDARLLSSKLPGGFYGRPCSLGEFNTHYIGGVAHELGHALGLPHERERPQETARRGASLMGGGNHTYGQELRGEGPGAFLTAAAALPLSMHPLFTGRRDVRRLACDIAELDATAAVQRLTVTGRISAGQRVAGIVAYNDPQDVPGDYDASGWTSKVDGDGRFRVVIEDVQPGDYELRLRVIAEDGGTEYFRFRHKVDDLGVANVEPLLNGPWLARARDAFKKGDADHLATVAAEAKQKRPRAAVLHEQLSHYQQLLAAKAPQPLGAVPRDTDSMSLADVAADVAKTGWGPALRNQVVIEGEASGLLMVDGEFFKNGLFAHAPARHAFRLHGRWRSLSARFGMQDGHDGTVLFVVKTDGREVFRSQRIADHTVRKLAIDVTDVDLLELIVEDAGDGNHSDWGVWLDPRITR